ncbi:subtilisin-like protein [Lactarius akahatsu]|uniref:tripeptidyl-peptidase II n=1 Tax=Lactarius akahatsu TaxID=416441 RepID=A0AAD4LI69_9AGAM|nr:subtilisin-like protein [Lactarius akahatsu]
MHYNWLSVLSVLTGSLFILATPLSPLWDDMKVKHAWHTVPANWEILGHPPVGTTINLYLALKPHREDALIDALYEVSDPRHPKHVLSATFCAPMYSFVLLLRCRYGLHLSKDQVAELVAPHSDTLELVYSWLEHHGVPSSSVSMTHGGSWLTLTGIPVIQANDLLGASYRVYQHAETKDRILRTVGYALPAVLHGHVRTVAPTTYFGSPRTPQQTPRNHASRAAAALAESASGEVVKSLSSRMILSTPSYLRHLYNMMEYVPAATLQNTLGVAGYFGDYPRQEDLTTFMENYRSDGATATFSLIQVGDEALPNEPNHEASSNIQYTAALTYPTPQTFYSTPNGEESYLVWANYVLAQQDIPQTISTSYGGDEQDFNEAYAIEVCRLFAMLGARGASVLYGSGNDGVGRRPCIVNDGTGRVQFLPMFPASCPFVTAVGGTISDGPEVGAPLSSGGFSNYFKRPDFQDRAVLPFLQNLGNRYNGLYNATSRGFPDLAAQAYNYPFIFKGELYLTQGTSCSVPTVAGVISLLNDYRLSKGKHVLGWLNPWLYSDDENGAIGGLNDIIMGSNPGCNTAGFNAIVGWDPVTGLGTPDFGKLLQIIDRLP